MKLLKWSPYTLYAASMIPFFIGGVALGAIHSVIQAPESSQFQASVSGDDRICIHTETPGEQHTVEIRHAETDALVAQTTVSGDAFGNVWLIDRNLLEILQRGDGYDIVLYTDSDPKKQRFQGSAGIVWGTCDW